jgi:hypothetical protein
MTKITKTLFAAFAASSILCAATGVRADVDGSRLGPAYGLVSIAASQTLRLTLFNGSTGTSTSCTVRASLIDALGTTLGTATTTLAPGQLAVLDAASFVSPAPARVSKNSARPLDAVTHISLRPQITFATSPVDPCGGILPTFEIADAASGETALIARAHPVDPCHPTEPCFALSTIFGFTKTTSDVMVRLSLVNTSTAAGACQVNAGFVDNSGYVLQSQTASLSAGQSLILDQAGGALLRPMINFAPVDPCRGLIATTEVIDAASNVTRYFVPPNPVPPAFDATARN